MLKKIGYKWLQKWAFKTQGVYYSAKLKYTLLVCIQAHEAPSDKLTLTSERTTSVSDLASINDRASVDNLHQKPSLEGKSTNQRNRVTSSSATSRASRRSLGGKSANSGSFVRWCDAHASARQNGVQSLLQVTVVTHVWAQYCTTRGFLYNLKANASFGSESFIRSLPHGWNCGELGYVCYKVIW